MTASQWAIVAVIAIGVLLCLRLHASWMRDRRRPPVVLARRSDAATELDRWKADRSNGVYDWWLGLGRRR